MSDVRPIDANALLKMMVEEENRHPGAPWMICDIERYVTKLLPTINPDDLRPRGVWLTKEYHYGEDGESDEWVEKPAEPGDCSYCSLCLVHTELNGSEEYVLSNYCPNCGAYMMDGKEN